MACCISETPLMIRTRIVCILTSNTHYLDEYFLMGESSAVPEGEAGFGPRPGP